MKTFYLIECFDKETGKQYIPDPGIFETEKEAEIYCDNVESESLLVTYSEVRMGKYKI